MGLRSAIANAAMSSARSLGNVLGCEVAVEASGHELETKMVVPDSDKTKAWDDTHYVKGNLFVGGYANPVRLDVEETKEIAESDEVTGESPTTDVQQGEHVEVISSQRFASIIKNDLISQLINPDERLSKIQWVLLGIAGLQLMMFVMLIAVAAATGVF